MFGPLTATVIKQQTIPQTVDHSPLLHTIETASADTPKPGLQSIRRRLLPLVLSLPLKMPLLTMEVNTGHSEMCNMQVIDMIIQVLYVIDKLQDGLNLCHMTFVLSHKSNIVLLDSRCFKTVVLHFLLE